VNKLALVRIEYKLDMIIQALKNKGLMMEDLPPLVGIDNDLCSICNEAVRIVNDFETETPVYTCGCEVPVAIVPGISTLLTRNTNGRRTQEDPVSPDSPPPSDRDR
jgi:hypothetical protein